MYFITSEQFHGNNGHVGQRKYTVRKFTPETGDVGTAGKFNELTRASAIGAAKRLAAGEPVTLEV